MFFISFRDCFCLHQLTTNININYVHQISLQGMLYCKIKNPSWFLPPLVCRFQINIVRSSKTSTSFPNPPFFATFLLPWTKSVDTKVCFLDANFVLTLNCEVEKDLHHLFHHASLLEDAFLLSPLKIKIIKC